LSLFFSRLSHFHPYETKTMPRGSRINIASLAKNSEEGKSIPSRDQENFLLSQDS
jgi:hypothetical protein